MFGNLGHDAVWLVVNNTQEGKTNVQELGEDQLVWFTDGFKMDLGDDFEVKRSRFKLSILLGNTLSIYQAGKHAIETCTQNVSKGASEVQDLNPIRQPGCTESFEVIHLWVQAALRNRVILVSMPDHKGNKGNEETNWYPRTEESQYFLLWSGTFLSTHQKPYEGDIMTMWPNQLNCYWNNLTGRRQVKGWWAYLQRKKRRLDSRSEQKGNGKAPLKLQNTCCSVNVKLCCARSSSSSKG